MYDVFNKRVYYYYPLVTIRAVMSSVLTWQPEKLPMDTICVPLDNNVVSTAKLRRQTSLGPNSTDDRSMFSYNKLSVVVI